MTGFFTGMLFYFKFFHRSQWTPKIVPVLVMVVLTLKIIYFSWILKGFILYMTSVKNYEFENCEYMRQYIKVLIYFGIVDFMLVVAFLILVLCMRCYFDNLHQHHFDVNQPRRRRRNQLTRKKFLTCKLSPKRDTSKVCCPICCEEMTTGVRMTCY
jgi:uncharacterized membrane protein YjgN (DUF898 family)